MLQHRCFNIGDGSDVLLLVTHSLKCRQEQWLSEHTNSTYILRLSRRLQPKTLVNLTVVISRRLQRVLGLCRSRVPPVGNIGVAYCYVRHKHRLRQFLTCTCVDIYLTRDPHYGRSVLRTRVTILFFNSNLRASYYLCVKMYTRCMLVSI